MNRLLLLLTIFLGGWVVAKAQVAADALRFSSVDVLGTARTVGVGGGLGALGADFSVLGTNPAGMASYRRSEFTVTPSLFLDNTEASLDGSNNAAVQKNKFAFNLNNLGLVFARQGRNPNWRTSNISFGINRIASFQQTFTYRGATPGSYIDFFQEESIGQAPSELSNFTTGLAFDTQALYDLDDDLFYETDVELNENALLSKEQTVKRRGGINELSLAFSGNYKDRLSVGLALGFPILSYTEEKDYSENDTTDEVPAYRNMRFQENLTTSGSGVNLKLGFILRLSQMVRIGAAVHTPTNFTFTDKYSTSMLHDYVDDNNDGALESASPESEFEYQLKTPWRFIGSAGFIIKRAGFITAEVEYLNFGGSDFDLVRNDNSSSTQQFQDELNNEIASIYQSAINVRLGGEYAIKMFRLRAGLTLSGTPYADSYIRDNPNIKGIGSTSQTYALGFGVRQQRYFLDFAYRFADKESTYLPYSVSETYPQNTVTNSSLQNHLLFTFGYKF